MLNNSWISRKENIMNMQTRMQIHKIIDQIVEMEISMTI